MKIRFLLDENLPPRIEGALRDLDAQIDVIRVGDPGTPTLGTLDPDILTYLESSQRVLVTGNRRSIPKHLAAHMAAGRHHFGIAWVRRGTRFSDLVDAIYLVWAAAEAEEWADRTDWLPY